MVFLHFHDTATILKSKVIMVSDVIFGDTAMGACPKKL